MPPNFLTSAAGLWQKWRERLQPGRPQPPDSQRYAPLLAKIREREAQLRDADPTSLEKFARELRSASPSIDRTVGAMAFGCTAAERTLGLRPFDVQLLAALAMHDGYVVEMQTGEGKTLAAALTVLANALDGGGVHVWTANDYLARRDAQWMAPIYRAAGLSVGFVNQGMNADERRAAYASNVTYATPNEVGFDFLRDNLCLYPSDLTQRDFSFVLIDEIDSILIDEARIPLVIAGDAAHAEHLAREMARIVRGFRRGRDFTTDEYARNVQLTDRGVAAIERALKCGNLFEPRNLDVFTAAHDAVHAAALLRRDVDYVVRDGAIESVDEFKGRIAQNRRWPAGLQTALEAKEGLALKEQGRILGSITLQNLLSLYPRACGMTATAATQWEEFRQVYDLEVVIIPPNRPVLRDDRPDRIFVTKAEKQKAVVDAIARAHAAGQPVLVGTASVEESEQLSAAVTRAGIAHEVLNAKNDEAEAAIVARAGEAGHVTISTNMAGRGTDIPLGDGVAKLGGLFVIGTNRHEARRIDHQLRGRAGRQGDPGCSQFFVSLEDDLLERYGIREVLASRGDADTAGIIEHVQRVVEGQNLEIRQTLWKYEKLIEHQRREIHELRRRVLMGTEPSIVERCEPELFAKLRESLRDGTRGAERMITLTKIDELWADYLAAIADLRGGIHWVALGGSEDPLHAFVTSAAAMFDRLKHELEEEIVDAVRDPRSLAHDPNAPDLRRGATWTYLVNDSPFEAMRTRWAKRVAERLHRITGAAR